jgi:diguanylate cyclase (GGDEF)-like protein
MLAAAIVAVTTVISLHLRDRAIADSERQLSNTALVLAEQADRAFGALELVQAGVIETMGKLSISSPEDFRRRASGYDMHQLLKGNISGLPYVEAAALIDAQGKIVNFSRFWPIPDIDASNRDFFKAFKTDPQLTSFLGAPLVNQTIGTPSIYLARKLAGPNGELLGLVTGGIELKYFDELFAKIALGPDSTIALFRRDGVLLARHPARLEPGTSYSNIGLMNAGLLNRDHAIVRFRSRSDGSERIVAAHGLPHYPVAIGVGTSPRAALSDWREQIDYLTAATVLIVLIIGGIVIIGARQLKSYELLTRARADRVEAEAARAAAEAVLKERERADEQVRHQKLQLDSALCNMSQGLVMFDREARLRICNERYRTMYGLPAEIARPGTAFHDIIAYCCRSGVLEGDTDRLNRIVIDDIARRKPVSRVLELGDGRIVSVSSQPMTDGGWVSTHEDITERRQAEARIAYLAQHNPVTELPNRSAFNARLADILERAKAKDESVGLLCVDIDRFKEINDLFGQPVGDLVLRQCAARFKAAAEGAFLANMGGDEFALIAEGPQPVTAEALAGRLSAAATEEIEVEGHRLGVTLSMGVAIFPSDGADASTLMARANAALDRAKKEGRRTCRFFNPELDERQRERRALQNDLRHALQLGELTLHYQPQARIDGTIIGFEALARWHHPKRGLVPPGIFVPLAEENELIVPIGEWLLREACREAASWSEPLQISLNLSPVQLKTPDLVRVVHSVLIETGLTPSRLELEITEGALIGDYSHALAILRHLKALGVHIAMDDFGTGYSSLSYLQSFPFDKIKIDKSFITNVDRDVQSGAIVKAIISLARSLGLPAIAEGVETKAQLDFLARQSCDEIQGYLIGHPRPIEDYRDLVGHLRTGLPIRRSRGGRARVGMRPI